jgi:hypothetical protein
MYGTIKKKSREILGRVPFAAEFIQRRDLARRFRVEIDLLAGRHQSLCPSPSIIHYSVNKAATQYVKRILRGCAVERGMTPVGLHDYAFHSNLPYLDDLNRDELRGYSRVFRPEGYLYSVFGGMVEGIAEFEKYRVVLLMRDPRDVLVSSYFSVAFSHVAPASTSNKRDDFWALRRAARELSLDEYVLRESPRVLANYENYRDRLVARYPHVHITKYEDMTRDFAAWLTELVDYCGFDASPGLLERLQQEHEKARPSTESVHRHLRKGRPGDHVEKLQPATVARLNETFGDVLNAFGYG